MGCPPHPSQDAKIWLGLAPSPQKPMWGLWGGLGNILWATGGFAIGRAKICGGPGPPICGGGPGATGSRRCGTPPYPYTPLLGSPTHTSPKLALGGQPKGCVQGPWLATPAQFFGSQIWVPKPRAQHAIPQGRLGPVGSSTPPLGRVILHGGGGAPGATHQAPVWRPLLGGLQLLPWHPPRLPPTPSGPRCGRLVGVGHMLAAPLKLGRPGVAGCPSPSHSRPAAQTSCPSRALQVLRAWAPR